MPNTTPVDKEPLANYGPDPLERIFQQLVIITLILKEAYDISDQDYDFYNQNTGPQNPNVNPNFTEPL